MEEPKGLVPESRFVGCEKLADDRTEETGGCPRVLGSC